MCQNRQHNHHVADRWHGGPRAKQPLDEVDGHRTQRATPPRRWRGYADIDYGLKRPDPQPR
ncbi:hypothetical protein L9F63_025144, partial [Diploptera punctata]